MTKFLKRLALGLFVLALPAVATAQSFSEDEIKKLALEAILENPEIIRQAVEILQRRDESEAEKRAAATLSGFREQLERDPNAPVLGNPDGDVTVVEFFDYNCPYCKRAADDVKKLIETDGNIRLVYREWPILSEGSVFAARAALAAREQGVYEEMHWALMSLPKATEASVLKAARKLGLDIDKLRADMKSPEIDAHIQLSSDLAQGLGFSGTPSFVIGENLVPGLVPLEQLQAYVEDAREDK